MLQINPEIETKRIIKFIKDTLEKQGFKNLVIGVSGGIDSSTSLVLAQKAIGKEKVFSFFLPYKKQKLNAKAYQTIDISQTVDSLIKATTAKDKIIIANIIARVRMIMLFAKAQKHRALVLGTENRSENLLGYFTRFGDAASDIEPISHLYKTQIYQLAKYLKIPQNIINAKPTAGLWPNQTDEAEFGFSYKLADEILYCYFDQKEKLSELEKKFGEKTVKKVLKRVKNNLFKQFVPYRLQPVFSKA